ncbi:hypothetical protein CPB83DRAFT_887511 [Crepidotus variabilis]|uniref:F-box domain-containing protein n=1 Tax=Crepidotus variabilis TaxID=179855 RepID=A0A9P6JJ36_9AGAR|nr:hypothetical protein CPB83DRAFT_887511 [Crepidotus variabilis]
MDKDAKPCEAKLYSDEKSSQLRESIRSRNQYTLIAKLPPEVLSEVFLHAELASRKRPDGVREPKLRFNFSFVCQYWRIVALSTPDIWSTLPENLGSNWSSIMLERSKNAGLTIDSILRDCDTPQGKSFNSELQKVVATYSNKLVDLTISCDDTMPQEDLQMFLDALPLSAYRLRHLRFALDAFSRQWPTIPESVFSDTRLSTLWMKGCDIAWTSSLMRGLEDLKITVGRSTSLLDFLDALKRMPSLKHLSLTHRSPFSDFPLSETRILLSSLQTLNVTLQPRDFVNVLRYLVVPASVVVEFRCFGSPDQEDTEIWSSSIRTFFSSMKGNSEVGVSTFQTLSISNDPNTKTSVRAWHQQLDGPFSTLDITPNFLFISRTVEPWLAGLFNSLPLSNLKTLKVLGLPSQPLLIQSFGDLPELETIHFDDSTQITRILQFSDIEDSSPIAFPHLQNLFMRCIFFSKINNSPRTSVDSLRECFLNRLSLGIPIQKISIIESSNIKHDDIRALSEIVPSVSWDGIEDYYGEEEDKFYA